MGNPDFGKLPCVALWLGTANSLFVISIDPGESLSVSLS